MSFDYKAIYTEDFFQRSDGIREWASGKLRYGDALAALAYAFGWPGFEALREACNLAPHCTLGRDVDDGGLTARDQLAVILRGASRYPSGLLGIGGGRGEVSVSVSHLGYAVQSIEPSLVARPWFARTASRFFDLGALPESLTLINEHLPQALETVDWTAVDTVLMVESLEHIVAADFAPVYDAIVANLRPKHGRFIVTNWIDYHPIAVGQYAGPDVHCRLVDDALYDLFSADAERVAYRNGSHLVLDY